MAKSNNPLFNQVSGKIGSIVVTQDGDRAIVRERVYRNTSETPAQQRQRATFTGLAQNWKALTPAQSDAWHNVSAQTAFTAGSASRNKSGYRMFCALNGNLIACGQPIVTTAPADPAAPPVLPPLMLEAGLARGVFTLSVAAAAYDGMVQVYATRPVPAGRNSFGRSAFRLIGTLDGLAAGITPLADLYVAAFGTPALGQKLAIRLCPVSDDGVRGYPIETSALVTSASAAAAAAPADQDALKAA